MKIFANILAILGFCIAALGAAGFEPSETAAAEPRAIPLLVGGIAMLIVGAVLLKQQKAGPAAGEEGASQGRTEVLGRLEGIRDEVASLSEGRETMESDEVRSRIDGLLSGPYFDLTSRNEELIALVGFSDYARVWEGVANAERRLARCWSLCTDGHADEGLPELPVAQRELESACQVMASL